MLTLTLSILTGVVGYGLKYFFESSPSRVLAVRSQVSQNLIGLDERARTGIVASYKLKGAKGEDLQSYFQYRLRVRNAGGVGAENVIVALQNNTEGLSLLKSPAVSTDPATIQLGLKLVHSPSEDPNHDEWSIPLLNPAEAVEFTYVAYSQHPIDTASLVGIARLKDWQTVQEGDKAAEQRISPLQKRIGEMRGVDAVILFVFFVAIQSVFNFYVSLMANLLPFRRFFRPERGFR